MRTSVMRLCVGSALTVVLAAVAFAQNSNSIDLKPDASGAVSPEQIRALLLRAQLPGGGLALKTLHCKFVGRFHGRIFARCKPLFNS